MARKEKFFLISPFHPDFNEVHEALAEAASRFEYLTIDKSDTQTPGEKKLFQDIRDRIRASAFVIADISVDPRTKGQNANVMLEAGFAMGHSKDPFFISRPPLSIPSDINQYRVHTYDPKINTDDFVDQFERYLEEILILQGIDTDRVVRKRTSHAEILRWLNSLTRVLRDRVRATYVDDNGLWQINDRITFQPSKCTFTLSHDFDELEKDQHGESKYDQVAVECGAFYAQWNRGETPLRIVVKRCQRGNYRNEVIDKEHMVVAPKPLDSVSETEILQEFEKKLDEILPVFTPSLSRHAPLAKKLADMEEIVQAVRRIRVSGLDSSSQRLVWGLSGCKWAFQLGSDKSILVFLIDFRRWERNTGQPYWVRFEPKNPDDQDALEKWFKAMESLEVGEGSWTFPLETDERQPNAVATAFSNVAKTVIDKYKPKKESPEDVAVAEVVKIQISCLQCQKKLSVQQEFVGRQIRCLLCNAVFEVAC